MIEYQDNLKNLMSIIFVQSTEMGFQEYCLYNKPAAQEIFVEGIQAVYKSKGNLRRSQWVETKPYAGRGLICNQKRWRKWSLLFSVYHKEQMQNKLKDTVVQKMKIAGIDLERNQDTLKDE